MDLNEEWVVENIRPELVEHVKYQTHGGWTALEVTARSKSLDYQADDGDDIIHIRELKFVPQKMMRLDDTYDGDGEDIADWEGHFLGRGPPQTGGSTVTIGLRFQWCYVNLGKDKMEGIKLCYEQENWYKMPLGTSRKVKGIPKKIKHLGHPTNPPMKFLQGESDDCLFCCTASVFHFMGWEKEAEWFNEKRKDFKIQHSMDA